MSLKDLNEPEQPKEIEFDSADMYVVYRTIREFPDGLKGILQPFDNFYEGAP